MAKRLLIIDMLNLFIRNYTVNPSLDDNGVPVGGVKGTLGSIQKISKEVKPCLLYTSPSPRDAHESRMPSSA